MVRLTRKVATFLPANWMPLCRAPTILTTSTRLPSHASDRNQRKHAWNRGPHLQDVYALPLSHPMQTFMRRYVYHFALGCQAYLNSEVLSSDIMLWWNGAHRGAYMHLRTVHSGIHTLPTQGVNSDPKFLMLCFISPSQSKISPLPFLPSSLHFRQQPEIRPIIPMKTDAVPPHSS